MKPLVPLEQSACQIAGPSVCLTLPLSSALYQSFVNNRSEHMFALTSVCGVRMITYVLYVLQTYGHVCANVCLTECLSVRAFVDNLINQRDICVGKTEGLFLIFKKIINKTNTH